MKPKVKLLTKAQQVARQKRKSIAEAIADDAEYKAIQFEQQRIFQLGTLMAEIHPESLGYPH